MAKYAIDSREDRRTGVTVFRVWQIVPGDIENVLLGEYDTLASAKASIAADWRPPDDEDHLAHGFDEPVPRPKEDDYPST